MTAGAPKSHNNVTSTFFITAHLLPKKLSFEHEGAKLASCPGRHLTSLHPCVFHLILAMTVFGGMAFTVLVSCSDYVRLFACKVRIRNFGVDCSTIGLYFVTITWQQIFKGSLQVTGNVAILADLLPNLVGLSHCQQ